MKRKVGFAVIAVIAISVSVFLFAQRRMEQQEKTPAVEFSVSIKREDVIDLIENKTNFSGLRFISGFIPETVDIACRAELTGEGAVPIRVSKLSVNGREIPHELCEKYLDFRCSLVYN